MASEAQLNAARDNVRKMAAMGASDDDINTYMAHVQQATGTLLDVAGLMRMAIPQHPETLPSQSPQPAMELPLAAMRANEQSMLRLPEGAPGRLAKAGAVLGAGVGAGIAGPALMSQLLSTTAGTFGGQMAGEGLELAKGDDIGVGSVSDALGRAGKSAATNAAFMGALGGLGKMFSFFRGAKPTATQKLGQEHAAKTKEGGFSLPATAEDFAERTLSGKAASLVRNMSVSARIVANQQGQKVARYIGENLSAMQKTGSITAEPSNAVSTASAYLTRVVAPKLRGAVQEKATRLGQGIGEAYQEPFIWLNEAFSPANKAILDIVKKSNPELFDYLSRAWITSAIRANAPTTGSNPFLGVNGPGFREWFESNAPMVRQVFGKATHDVWDRFTAYVAFGSRLAERTFPEGSVQKAAANAFPLAGTGAAATVGGPVGSASFEGTTGALAWALSKPGNSIYKLFSKPIPFLEAAGRGVRLGGQLIDLPAGSKFKKAPRRERRSQDVIFSPPTEPKGLR